MPIEIDFKDHDKLLVMIKDVQEAEQDSRNAVMEAKLFISERDGQWDPYAVDKMDGRYRGTFDMCTPIVDQIAGEIEQSDFTIRVSPSGGDASKETAKTLDGLIRNIRNISNAESVFQSAGRSNVIGGFDAWEVVQEFIEGDSFDQDLFIRRVPNASTSVWFDPGSVLQDRSDAAWGVKLNAIPVAEYKDMWPEGKMVSVGDNAVNRRNQDKIDSVTVGQIYFRKPRKIEIVLMSDGKVYQVDDDFEKVQDEFARAGINEVKRRTRDAWRVYSRMFDGDEWLADEEETVFDYVPLIPVYGNFDIVDNKTVYFGKLEKLYDQQRILNYAMSRDIEDGALSPAPAIWMTDEMAEGNDYESMNTDRAPVRIFNVDPENPGLTPVPMGGPQASTGLQATIQQSKDMITASGNIFAAQQGNANPNQSGVAGNQQIEQGNIGSIKWFKPLEVAICHTGKILINAIPRVYDSTRQVRILEEDGTSSMVMLNQTIFDEQTQTNVTLNDLSLGEYDAVCEVGPAFNNQQKETQEAFLQMASIDPTIAQNGMDVWLKNQKSPGMDLMAERYRAQLIDAGIIPQSQWTDEETQKFQQAQAEAANQPPQEDPNMVFARAEETKAQAEQMTAQNKQQETQMNAQIKMQELQLEQEKIQLEQQRFQREGDDKFNVDAAKIQQGQQKLDQDQQKIDFEQQMQELKIMQEQMKQQQQQLNDSFTNLKTMREAMGVDAIVGPTSAEAYEKQVDLVLDEQDSVEDVAE